MKIKNIKITKTAIFLWIVAITTAFLVYDSRFNSVDWRTANRETSNQAPDPKVEKGAVVQVYYARTYNWRGYFAVHPWIAVKKKNEDFYTTYQVAGFYLRRTGSSVLAQKDIPDRYWFGKYPTLMQTLTGEEAEKAIPEIEKAVKSYPYGNIYELWPGPNSNTFISYIIRNVPELTVELPPNALGKDFLGYTKYFAKSESGRGYQFSIMGMFGVTIGPAEGIEINIASLVFGVDFLSPAVKLPFIGRAGMKDKPL
ncbi:MAG: DUF3750 domain-containing protein [Lactobacillaceae bacterium]|nr:DUF3750 domain-containing protein [Lactobacillaceae bacterium]